MGGRSESGREEKPIKRALMIRLLLEGLRSQFLRGPSKEQASKLSSQRIIKKHNSINKFSDLTGFIN